MAEQSRAQVARCVERVCQERGTVCGSCRKGGCFNRKHSACFQREEAGHRGAAEGNGIGREREQARYSTARCRPVRTVAHGRSLRYRDPTASSANCAPARASRWLWLSPATGCFRLIQKFGQSGSSFLNQSGLSHGALVQNRDVGVPVVHPMRCRMERPHWTRSSAALLRDESGR